MSGEINTTPEQIALILADIGASLETLRIEILEQVA